MADNLTIEKRSKIMRSIRSKNTKPELMVRKLLTRLGYRYRLHDRKLPGHPDIVFANRKKVVFIHGCFWHGHSNCKIAHLPESELWQQKLLRNQERDKSALINLQLLGWQSIVIWECELKNPTQIENILVEFLGATKLRAAIK